jgi:hypothetical protein
VQQDGPRRATSTQVLLVGFTLVVCMGMICLCASLMLAPALGAAASGTAIPPGKALLHPTTAPMDPPSTPGLLDDHALVTSASGLMDHLTKMVDQLFAEKKIAKDSVLDPALIASELSAFQGLLAKAADPYGPGANQVRRMYFFVLVHCGLYRPAVDLVTDMIQHSSGAARAALRSELALMLVQHHLTEPLDGMLAELKQDPGADPAEVDEISMLQQAGHVAVGKPFPDFSLVDAQGASHRLGDYLGHPLLIVVWVSQSPAVIHELPAILRVRDQYAPRGLALLGIDCDVDAKPSDALPAQMRIPQVIARRQWKSMRIGPFGVDRLPTFILVSAHGILLSMTGSVAALDDQLASACGAP